MEHASAIVINEKTKIFDFLVMLIHVIVENKKRIDMNEMAIAKCLSNNTPNGYTATLYVDSIISLN